jgi:hypothetical protein
MSKAILVVDIPDDLKYDDLYFKGEIRYTNEFYTGYVFLKETGRCLLKPLPKIKEIEWSDSFGTHNYKNGYNDCIKDILGEEE